MYVASGRQTALFAVQQYVHVQYMIDLFLPLFDVH